MSIALLATGGTIACTQTENGLAPTLSASDLLARLHAPLPCPVITEDIFCMDSSNMQPEEWCVLAREVDRVLQTCDGVVITHGTDTMAYTAAALSYMLAGIGKPVILTGSQLPMPHPLSDAPRNLMVALTASAQGVGGVYVCFGTHLISGVRCVKTHTTSMHAFSSVNAPPSGRIDSDGVHFDEPQPFLPLHPGDGYRLRDTIDPRVLLLKLAPGTSPDVLRFAAEAGYRGLVIEAFGLGGLHYIRRNLVKALDELSAKGIYVLVVSQCLYEKADVSIYEVGRGLMREHVISGRDMTTESAVCKLMWALGQENPRQWLEHRLVGEYR